VFGPKREEVTAEWRKLRNEKLSDLYSLPNIVLAVKSRRMRWVGHVARMGEGRGVHRVLVGKPEGRIAVTCRTPPSTHRICCQLHSNNFNDVFLLIISTKYVTLARFRRVLP
jgi:hypothetical protein